MKKKKVLVDMSGTLIHHGHIRILKSTYFKCIISLTSDKEIKNTKAIS